MTAFGQKIEQMQAQQFKMGDMDARSHTARLAYREAPAGPIRF